MPPFTPKGTFPGIRRRNALAAIVVMVVLGITRADAATPASSTAPYDGALNPTHATRDPAGFGDAGASAVADASRGLLRGETRAAGHTVPAGQRLYNYDGAGYNYAFAGAYVVDRLRADGPGRFQVTIEVAVPSYTNRAETAPSPVPDHGSTAQNLGFADQIINSILWYHRCAPPTDCWSGSYEAGEIKTTGAWVANTAYPWVDVDPGTTLTVRQCLATTHSGPGQIRVQTGIEARSAVSGGGTAESTFEDVAVEAISVLPVSSCPG